MHAFGIVNYQQLPATGLGKALGHESCDTHVTAKTQQAMFEIFGGATSSGSASSRSPNNCCVSNRPSDMSKILAPLEIVKM